MSHGHLRKDKTCLNCGTEVLQRYCPKCGQENVEPKESAWQLIVHFFNDVTHFDGKFFSSMKYLLFYPGFLTKEYVIGHRARHLNPIRMYLFISAVFFLLYANSFVSKKDASSKKSGVEVGSDTSGVTAAKKAASGFGKIAAGLDSLDGETDNELVVLANGDTITQREVFHFVPKDLTTYDSFQRLLPKAQQESGLTRKFSRAMLKRKGYNEEDKKEMNHRMRAHFFHSIPYMLFISLPMLALFLKLFYLRRKQYYYVSHGIFVIHYFCFLFITLLLAKFLSPLGVVGNTIANVIYISTFVYLYVAMYKFYKQGWFKTFVKFFLFYCISAVFVGLLFLGLLLNSMLNVS